MKMLICGSRGWHDVDAVRDVLCAYQRLAEEMLDELVVIHGNAAKGADRIANKLCRDELGIEMIRENAQWKQHGKAAGPIRNQKMLDDHHPDVVWAFRANGKSNGTDDMIARAVKAGITTHVVTPDGERVLRA